MNSGKWKWISALFLCWALIASLTTIYYYTLYVKTSVAYNKTLEDLRSVSIRVNLCIDYGNGTKEWHNGTLLPAGSTLFNATIKVAKVEYEVYEGLGIFITSINGVENNPDKNLWWLWFYWDSNKKEWAHGPVGCGQWILHNNDIVMWKYMTPT